MPKYRYDALTLEGETTDGVIEAESLTRARNMLLGQDLQLTKLEEKKSLGDFEITARRIKGPELMLFSRQLGAFVRSGIPVLSALESLLEEYPKGLMHQVLVDAADALRNGASFADAVSLHAGAFPPYYVPMLRAAELTGGLDEVLGQLSQYVERDIDARRTVKSALTYPAIILLMSLGTVGVLVTFVLPKFATFFDSFGAKLPLPAAILVGAAHFFGKFWVYMAAGIGVFLAAAVLFLRSPAGRRFRDRMLLRLPAIGEIVRLAVVERFCRVFGAMIKAGVPLPDAMRAAADSARNVVFERALENAREDMLRGAGIAGPIRASGLFPRAAVQMMQVGEDTGSLDHQLETAGEFYERELGHKVKQLTTMFEPAVIVFMGLVVGFVAIALVSAMYGIFKGAHPGGVK
jgi:type IV pilus assembly protein PilC